MSSINPSSNNILTQYKLGEDRKIANSSATFIAKTGKNDPEKPAVRVEKEQDFKNPAPVGDITAIQKNEHAKTLFNTQSIAQRNVEKEEPNAYETARQKFLEYMELSPEERMLKAFLNKENLTEEQFAALPPEEKEKLMEKFREFVREQYKQTAAKEEPEETQL